MRFETVIDAPQETVFAYVADLTRHGEWAGNALAIEQVGDGVYRSVADVGRLQFTAELVQTVYDRPHRFGFRGEDKTGSFVHTFTFETVDGRTKVTRDIQFTLSLKQSIMAKLLYFPVRRPAGIRAMSRLKTQLESSS